MDDSTEEGNAFAIPDLWQRSSLVHFETGEPSAEIHALLPFESESQLLAFPHISFALPTLDISSDDPLQTFRSIGNDKEGTAPFSYGQFEDLELLDDLSTLSSDGGSGTTDDILGDLWSAKENLEPITQEIAIRSWERFHDKSFKEPRNVYISEAGPRVFDATLNHVEAEGVIKSFQHQPVPPLQSDALLSGLIQLALGRESRHFRYVEKEKTFKPVVEGIRMSGYTSNSFNSLTTAVISHGSRVRQARGFTTVVHGSKNARASLVAIASGIDTTISTLEAELSTPLASITTALQLQVLLEPSRVLLDQLCETIEKAGKLKTDEELLSMLFDYTQHLECSAPWLQPIMNQLLAHTSRPWLEALEGLLGLRPGDVMSTISVRTNLGYLKERKSKLVDQAGAEVDDSPHPRMPNFIGSDFAEALLEAEQSLELLQVHEPEHPLAHPQSSLEPPSLQWQFSWQDIEQIQARAEKYEADVLKALKEYNISGTFSLPQVHKVEQQLIPSGVPSETEAFSTKSISEIDSPLSSHFNPSASSLSTTVTQILNKTHPSSHSLNVPPTSLLPTLSFQPILSAQVRLLSHSTVRLLFHSHSLRTHLRLLHSYPLLANGPFLVRLSHALFDPSLPSAAYQKGRVRSGTAGLQLGARETTWPPASSELRIALMGILTESYHGSPEANGIREKDRGELPGELSFAIRNDMSDTELEKCMNKDGLEALDFLKIHYRPPKPLDVVVTEGMLEKYESVSRLLLRGARVGFVVKEMMRYEREGRWRRGKLGLVQRFKVEANHFVMTVFGYFGSSIEEMWMAFERRLDGIEESINCYEVGRQVEGVHRLRALHEEVLGQILAACLLRKRQELVMRLLEEILGLILEFAKIVRDQDEAAGEPGAADGKGDGGVGKVYEPFRKKVRVFITVCRGLQDQKSVTGRKDIFDGGKRGEERGNGIGRLVLCLEMNGWYMR
ncbi:MAG: hypothetical protein Q9225_002430 [Loekoesia sp. 1 TL-2023]